MSRNKKIGLVYSTDRGRLCPGCGLGQNACRCRPPEVTPTRDGLVRIGRETKGRKGAGVTIIRGLALASGELEQLAGALKKKCGAGGTVKDGIIEIQGDHRQLMAAELAGRGFKVKLAGG
jgi:translation initiation factor 1